MIDLLATFVLISVAGIGSLDELKNQLDTETKYESELREYLTQHNMTIPSGVYPSIDQLQSIVKKHMSDCKIGMHDYVVNMTKFAFENDKHRLGMELGLLGHC